MMRNIPLKISMENNVIFGNTLLPYAELDRRLRDRFKIDKTVYALISWNESEDQVFLGRLVDITTEGAAIYYMVDRNTLCPSILQKSCKLKIISKLKIFEFEKNTVIYDNEIMEYSTERISVRRCGIKFDNIVKVEYLR